MTGHIGEPWQKYCIEENFIGIGSTRKVYRHKNYAIKVHLHPIGYKQSLMENEIFQFMKSQGLASLFAETFYADPSVAVQKYYSSPAYTNIAPNTIPPIPFIRSIPRTRPRVMSKAEAATP